MPCLEDNDVVEYLEGLLSEDERMRIDAHLDLCSDCHTVVASAAVRMSLSEQIPLDRPFPTHGAESFWVPVASADVAPDSDRNEAGLRAVPEVPGRYSVHEVLGHGAQGWVFTAFDRWMRRDVALKCMAPNQGGSAPAVSAGPDASERMRTRFLREVQITARLNHPTNVHVYEMGRRDDGSLYYTMPVVRGPTLAQALAEATTLADRLALLRHFVDLCNGVAYAHSRGVIHRDIKPSNIMLGEFGETFLLDWGLAGSSGEKVAAACAEAEDLSGPASGHTSVGTLLGTPGYMSPEQASGSSPEIDNRSDIWSLGAVLYHILTGQPPHHHNVLGEIVRRTRNDDVVPVRALCAHVPVELAAVVEKALQRDPACRYTDARELASEIGAYMTGGRVVAYPYSAWEAIRRLVLRHKAAVAAVLTVVAVTLAAGVLLATSYARERSARQQETALRAKEHQATQLAEFHLAEAYAMKAQRCLEDGDLLSARVYAAASLVNNPYSAVAPDADTQQSEGPFLASEAAAILLRADVRHVPRVAEVLSASTPLRQVVVSPTGSTLVAASAKAGIRLWDLASLRMTVPERAEEERRPRVAISPDGSRVVVASGKRIRVRDATDGDILREFLPLEQDAFGIAFSSLGDLVVSGGRDNRLRVWDVDSGHLRSDWELDGVPLTIAVSPTGTMIAGMQNGDIWSWDLGGSNPPTRLHGHDEAVWTTVFSPDGQWFASGSADRRVVLWNTHRGVPRRELGMHRDAVNAVAFSPDGRWLLSAGRDGVAQGWNVMDGALAFAMTAPGHTMEDVAFTPDGRKIVTCGFDGTVMLWDFHPATRSMSLVGHQGHVLSLAYSTDGATLASGGTDGVVRIWDGTTAALRRVFPRGQRAIVRVALTSDGRRVVSGGFEGQLRVGEVSSGTTKASKGCAGDIQALALSPDGTQVVFASGSKDIHILRLDGLVQLRAWSGHSSGVLALAWSPDGTRIASGGEDGVVRLWDVQGSAMLAEHRLHGDWVSDLAFSPDGRWLASAGRDGSAIIWHCETRRVVVQLRKHGQWVNEIAFSTDGKMLATAGDDGRVIVWSTANWAPKLVLSTRGRAAALALAFAPDGNALAVGSRDAIELIPLRFELLMRSPSELLRQAEQDAGVRLRGMVLRPAGAP